MPAVKHPGEPDAGNPHVRFDEGRGHLTVNRETMATLLEGFCCFLFAFIRVYRCSSVVNFAVAVLCGLGPFAPWREVFAVRGFLLSSETPRAP